MMQIDEQTLERIIEEVTRQLLLVLQERASGTDSPQLPPLSASDFVDRVQPVVVAGADRLGTTLGVAPTDGRLAHMIDHTLLKPDATQDQIAQLCFEARKHSFASVCVNPAHVRLCAELLKGSGVPICTVIGFPLGATATDVKVFEAQQSIRDGASELDMVINVGALKSRDYELVERDIASIARTCHAASATGTAFTGVTPKPQGSGHIPTTADCATCHKSTTSFAGTAMNHSGISSGCATCHETGKSFVGVTMVTRPTPAQDPNHPTTGECSTCHSSTTFR